MHVPDDVATLQPGTQEFPSTENKGSEVVRHDLESCGIPYPDASRLCFASHRLRCETAALADAAVVSPRLVQKMMRYLSPDLAGNYTKPSVLDIEATTDLMPNPKPREHPPVTFVMTGTDLTPAFRNGATYN